MAWTATFNFRSTSTYVTDSGGETYVISATNVASTSAEAYPTTRNTITFGWDTANVGTRDRDNVTPDHRFSGCHFNGTENANDFRVDLPSAGTYSIRIAAGDYSGTHSVKFEVFDNASSTGLVVSGATSAGDRFLDAVGTEYTSANWLTSNTAVNKTFSSTVFKLRIGDGLATVSGFVAHLIIDQVSVGSSSTKPMWPMSFF